MSELQSVPLAIRRCATVLADAVARGASVAKLPEYARLVDWLAPHVDHGEGLDLDDVFIVVHYDTLASTIAVWNLDEVRDQLALDDEAELGASERRAFVAHVLQGLLDDADASRACTTVAVPTADGRAVHVGTGRYGYSFTVVGDEWYGVFASAAAFRAAMERGGWIESIDELSDAAIAQLWANVRTEPAAVPLRSVTDPRRGVERLSRAGEVLVTTNRLVLLQGLLDRPDGTAVSIGDWLRAARPYAMQLGSTSVGALGPAAARIPEAWVERVRAGRCLRARLTERGRAIVSAAVPVRVVGVGAYRGWAALVRDAKRRA